MRTIDDRNRLILAMSKFCKTHQGRTLKVTGIDVVEMQLWAQKNVKVKQAPKPKEEEAMVDDVVEEDVQLDCEEIASNEELVSKDEEEDMDALLGMYVLGIDEAEAFSERLKRELHALDDANIHAILENAPLVDEVTEQLDESMSNVEDLESWLGAINIKLRHMREDIASIESRNNSLEIQAHNSNALLKELDVISGRFRVPPNYAATLRTGSFEEAKVGEIVEACKWLASALHDLEPSSIEPSYMRMRAVREKHAELGNLKDVFLSRATQFLSNYFSSVVESMLNDKSAFSQKGQLRKPDHSDLRYKCRIFARLIQHMKALDKNSLVPLRKSFCMSLNLLLRREAREFARELQSSTVVKQSITASLDRLDSGRSQQSLKESPSSSGCVVSDAYAKMLQTFIPYLVDESSFFTSFMCFGVQPLAQPEDDEDDVEGDADIPITPKHEAQESKMLKEALQELLNGIQEDFYAIVDWAHRLDPWSCISMKAVTEKYLSSHKAEAAWFVYRLLGDLQTRISAHFNQVVADTCKQYERPDRGQSGVLFSIIKFANLSALMESQIMGQSSRESIDEAYRKLAGTIFEVIDMIAKNDPRNSEIFLLDNYAAFQDRMYELANVTPILERFYNQAADAYAEACVQYVHTMINYQFERLFLFVQKVENLLISVEPDQVSSMLGYTRTDLRKTLKASLSGVEKSLQATYKRMQRSIQRQDVLSTLWNSYFKEKFLEKYKVLEEILAKCYKDEALHPSSVEMKAILDGMYSN